ncbi:MAG: LytTR family DNA-binding domain-containing protein [Acidobacteriota bacterium]
MRALIVDDERLARNELRRLLVYFPEIIVVGEAQNADQAIKCMEELKPDLLFLDIQMPGKDGFALLEELDTVPLVLFTTAYDEFALKAFDFNALDYLLKPIELARLAQAINKVEEIFTRNTVTSPANILKPTDQVFVRDGEQCWFIKIETIQLFESEGNYTRLYFGTHRPLIPRSLNALEERLDAKAFFRANRKHIVNLAVVESVETAVNGGLILQLSGGQEIEVSRRQAQIFRERKGF